MWSVIQRVMWLNGLDFVIVSHHFTKVSGHRPCGSSDAVGKTVCDLRRPRIKGSDDFMKGKPSLYIPYLPKLIAIGIVLMDIQLFGLPRDISRPRNYMVMWLYG